MKKIGLLLVMVVIGLRVSAQSAISDTAKFYANKNEISTFLNLMHIAGLDSLYSGQPVTIFAPDNEAFEKLPVGMLDSLSQPANKQMLIALLNVHLVFGELSAKDLGIRIRKSYLVRQNTGLILLSTLSGANLMAKINANRNIYLTDENGKESIVSQFDIKHSNATFFIVKSVLFPKK